MGSNSLLEVVSLVSKEAESTLAKVKGRVTLNSQNSTKLVM
jgi:hypothetical protein